MTEFYDALETRDPQAREEADYKRSVSRSEWIYGSLDDAQTTLLAKVSKTAYFDPEVVIAERKLRQAELVRIVKDAREAAKAGPRDETLAKLQVSLRSWAEEGLRSPRPEYRAYQKRMQIEETFRDLKSHRWGLSLQYARSRSA